jgi:hypothetical protein
MSVSELIIGMVILAIVGLALTGTLRSQARYFDHQKTSNLARAVSRGPINRVVSDLRMVEATGGVFAASPTQIDVRVPFAMGVVCGTGPNGSTHISLLPVDSAMFAGDGYSGYAWRGGDGSVFYDPNNKTKATGSLNVCTNVNIGVLSAGKVIKIAPALPAAASYGTPVFLFRNIRYTFGPSQMVPGTTGLFRTLLETGITEELSAPYESTAKFRFFVGTSLTAQDAAPADLSTLRGIELDMIGLSERAPYGATAKERAPFVTAVFFKNRLD